MPGQRFQNTDLVGTLLDGYKQHVHNTDTADDKYDHRHGD
jgi:hypothetical protein